MDYVGAWVAFVDTRPVYHHSRWRPTFEPMRFTGRVVAQRPHRTHSGYLMLDVRVGGVIEAVNERKLTEVYLWLEPDAVALAPR